MAAQVKWSHVISLHSPFGVVFYTTVDSENFSTKQQTWCTRNVNYNYAISRPNHGMQQIKAYAALLYKARHMVTSRFALKFPPKRFRRIY